MTITAMGFRMLQTEKSNEPKNAVIPFDRIELQIHSDARGFTVRHFFGDACLQHFTRDKMCLYPGDTISLTGYVGGGIEVELSNNG